MVQHTEKMTGFTMEHLNVTGLGLEVSPYYDPFILKKDHHILYTDYIDNDAIKQKAHANPDLKDCEVPDVDFVWIPGQPLKTCIPPGTRFNYIIASHVMEHVPNPIGWLNDLLSVMEDNGQIVLFLPERRANADFFRQETQFHHLAQWWIEQPIVPTPGQILDFMSNSFEYRHGDLLAFSEAGSPVDTERAYTDENAIDLSIFSYNEASYTDIHCTVWNADTFESVFQRVIASGIINVEVTALQKDRLEFVAILRKCGEPKLQPPSRRLNISRRVFDQALALDSRIQAEAQIIRGDLLQAIAAQNALQDEVTRWRHTGSDISSEGSRKEIETLKADLAHARNAFAEAVTLQNKLQADLAHARGAFTEAVEVQNNLLADLAHARHAFAEAASIQERLRAQLQKAEAEIGFLQSKLFV